MVHLLAMFSAVAVMHSYAASNVSPRFDGIYAGTLVPMPWMSKRECTELPVQMTVRQGIFRNPKAPVSLEGFVTEDGFVTGHLRRAGSPALVFEGRLNEGQVSAGVIDEQAGCYWTATLTIAP